jgi:hypothetical protein
METILNHPWVLGSLLAVLLALALELGHRVAAYTSLHKDQDRKDQMATIRDGLFVLVSLLLGFTLALASPRYAERRLLIVEEALSIGTTYLRTSALPPPQREHSQLLLREYLDACLEFGNAGLDAARFAKAMQSAKRIQEELWVDAASVMQIDRSAIIAVYIKSLNETIDLHDKRLAGLENRVPQSVWLLILSISLIAVFARGLTLPARFWLTVLLVPITIAIVVALVADLDTPSSGLIRLDQRPLERLKADLSAEPTH